MIDPKGTQCLSGGWHMAGSCLVLELATGGCVNNLAPLPSFLICIGKSHQIHMEGQTYRITDNTYRRTDLLNDRHTDGQTYRQTDTRTERHTDGHIYTDIKTDRHTDRQTYGWTDIQTDRNTDGQTYGQTYIPVDRHTDGHTYERTYIRTDRHTDGQTYGPTDIMTDRYTDGQTYERTVYHLLVYKIYVCMLRAGRNRSSGV